MLSDRFEEALRFTTQLHCGQLRKGTKIPYISHLLSVAGLVLEAGGSEDEAIGALLHDSIEDRAKKFPGGAPALRDYIKERFGETVLEIVNHCTDADVVPKPPWRKRKQDYIDAIADKPTNALLVSCADKLHNARAILLDYRTHGEDLWDRFKGGRESLWYYQSLVEEFGKTGRLPEALLDELERTVNELDELASDKKPVLEKITH